MGVKHAFGQQRLQGRCCRLLARPYLFRQRQRLLVQQQVLAATALLWRPLVRLALALRRV